MRTEHFASISNAPKNQMSSQEILMFITSLVIFQTSAKSLPFLSLMGCNWQTVSVSISATCMFLIMGVVCVCVGGWEGGLPHLNCKPRADAEFPPPPMQPHWPDGSCHLKSSYAYVFNEDWKSNSHIFLPTELRSEKTTLDLMENIFTTQSPMTFTGHG